MSNSDENKFKAVIPATLEKSKDGEWRVYGLASNQNRDLQGETVNLEGLDLSPIEKGKGIFNFDHQKGPENTIGAIDTYKKGQEGLYLGGYLFKEHDRAKAVYQIMNSLKKSDRGRMGMSIEGIIKQRTGEDNKKINKAVITSCALTMNPVNTETYADLVKSLSGAEEVEFKKGAISEDFLPHEEEQEEPQEKADDGKLYFSSDQVVGLVQKALSVGGEYASTTPSERSGGAALAQEDLDSSPKSAEHDENNKKKEKKSKKEVQKGSVEFFKSEIYEVLDKLQELYPDVSKTTLWEKVKDRLNTKFESIDLE